MCIRWLAVAGIALTADQHVRRLRRHAAHAGDVPQITENKTCHDEPQPSVAYIGATILFILSLGGLSNPETSRRGNLYGMIGMAIAVLATVLGPRVTRRAALRWIVGALVVGGAIGLYLGAHRADDADAGTGRASCTAWWVWPRCWSATRATSTRRRRRA